MTSNNRAAQPFSGSPRWYLLLAVLPIFSFVMHFRGHIVLGWDSIPPIRPELLFRSALSAWDGRAYLGQANVFALTALPLALVTMLLHSIVGIIWTDRLVLTVLFVLPAYTMYYAAKASYPRAPEIWFLAGWLYALSPWLFTRFYVPIYTVALAYALTPLVVLAWLRLTDRRVPLSLRLLFLALCEIAFIPSARNLAFWVAPHILAIFFAAAVAYSNSRSQRPAKLRVISLGLLVTVLLNSFWLGPQIVFGFTSGPAVANQAVNKTYSEGVQKDVAENSGLSYTLRMSSRAMTDARDQYGPYWTYANILSLGPIAAIFYGWIALAFAALAFYRKDVRAIALGLLLLLAIYIMKGASAPLPFALELLNRIPLIGTIFRDGYDKLLSSAAFCVALLCALMVRRLALRSTHARTIQVGAVLMAFVVVFPYWTGQMFMVRPKGPTLSSIPPAALLRFSSEIDSLSGRLLFTPTSDNSLLLSTRWGFYGPNIYGSLTAAPFVAGPVSTLNLSDVNNLISNTYRALYDGDRSTFSELAKDLGIGYVFVASDVDSHYYGGSTSATDVELLLRRLPYAHPIKQIGPYALWKLFPSVSEPSSLIREPMIGYDSQFDEALALKRYCGRGDFALIWSVRSQCRIEKLGAGSRFTKNTFVVRGTMNAKLSVIDGKLAGVARGSGTQTPISVALPEHAQAAALDGFVVEQTPVDVDFRAGALQHVEALLVGRRRSAGDVSQISGEGVSLLRHSGAVVLQCSRNAWASIPTLNLPQGETLLTVRVRSFDMKYQLAVVDGGAQDPEIMSSPTGSDEASVMFRSRYRHQYSAYLFLIPQRPDATLEIEDVSSAPVRTLGTTTFSIRRTIRSLRSSPTDIAVRGTATGRAEMIHGTLAQLPYPTAVVLNTQYDPMWIALLSRPGVAFPAAPAHVISDGFKNAWILPANAGGTLHVFYLTDTVWLIGLASSFATIFMISLASVVAVARRSQYVRV